MCCCKICENFMGPIITGDETWVYGYDPETKRQSSQWKSADSPRPKKARQVRPKVKVKLIAFFDMEGTVHDVQVPQGQTVNQQFYQQVLKRVRLAVSRKRPQKRVAGAWALHHDNAPAHKAHSINVFLANHGIPVVQKPPYSPDMAPCDFWLFPQLKTVLKGNKFEDIEIKKNTTSTLNTIPKDFQNMFPAVAGPLEGVCQLTRKVF
jgi:histone-lysine N-methyltransferase SETMAR